MNTLAYENAVVTASKINKRVVRIVRDANANARMRESALSYLFLARKWALKNCRPATAVTVGRFIKMLMTLKECPRCTRTDRKPTEKTA